MNAKYKDLWKRAAKLIEDAGKTGISMKDFMKGMGYKKKSQAYSVMTSLKKKGYVLVMAGGMYSIEGKTETGMSERDNMQLLTDDEKSVFFNHKQQEIYHRLCAEAIIKSKVMAAKLLR